MDVKITIASQTTATSSRNCVHIDIFVNHLFQITLAHKEQKKITTHLGLLRDNIKRCVLSELI